MSDQTSHATRETKAIPQTKKERKRRKRERQRLTTKSSPYSSGCGRRTKSVSNSTTQFQNSGTTRVTANLSALPKGCCYCFVVVVVVVVAVVVLIVLVVLVVPVVVVVALVFV